MVHAWLIVLPPQTRSSTDAAHIKLDGVRRDLRFFIEQYRQGHRETTDLVSSESLKTREHVSLEANKAVALVGQKFDRLVMSQEAQVDDQARDRFLQSFKFPDFNQRRNQIDDAYGDTLKWVFVGDHDDSDEHHDFGDPEFPSTIKWDSFSNWLSSTDTIYWISGKPGSGKTTLVKYIVDQDRTKKYLNVWSPGCEIASHYFWRPGSTMQRNMEGLFCSLLYQLLGCNTTALRKVMSSVSGPKESHTDWSSSELRSTLMKTLGSYENGVCLFLDGIDEINPENETKDGIPEFLDWASKLPQRTKIKLCLASRPGPYVLETKLSRYSQLRLQDLNYEDLMSYAKEHVEFSETETFEDQSDPIQSLVVKAEGVFLWLILATKSINEGLRNYDSAASLQERIDRLPKGLDSLYQDMWARAGADTLPGYAQIAALYFKFLLAIDFRIRNGWSMERPWPLDRYAFHDALNIFDLMLATTIIADGVLDALDGTSNLVCPDTMLKRCQEVERKVKICCFGIVELGAEEELNEKKRDTSSWYGHMYDIVWPMATSSTLQFIHRTARDFLTDTESGRKILNSDTKDGLVIDYHLVKARLAKFALFAESRAGGAIWAYNLRCFGEAWGGTNVLVKRGRYRLLLICEKLANSGRLVSGHHRDVIPCFGTDFLRVLAQWNCDDEFIISRLKDGNLSGSQKSAILMGLSSSGSDMIYFSMPTQPRPHTFRELLSAGADPNWQTWEPCLTFPAIQLETPWRKYLFCLMANLYNDAPYLYDQLGELLTNLAICAEVALTFITEGAKLDDMVHIYISANWKDYARPITTATRHNPVASPGIFISVSAYAIVRILTATMRRCSSHFGVGSLPGSCVSLERACVDQRSSKMCRVFGKLEIRDQGSQQCMPMVLCETTDDVQTRLGSKFIEGMEKRMLLNTSDGSGGGSNLEVCYRSQIIQSIINDEFWIPNLDLTSKHAQLKWLEELGLVKLVNRRPTIQQWVEKHSQEILESGIPR